MCHDSIKKLKSKNERKLRRKQNKLATRSACQDKKEVTAAEALKDPAAQRGIVIYAHYIIHIHYAYEVGRFEFIYRILRSRNHNFNNCLIMAYFKGIVDSNLFYDHILTLELFQTYMSFSSVEDVLKKVCNQTVDDSY